MTGYQLSRLVQCRPALYRTLLQSADRWKCKHFLTIWSVTEASRHYPARVKNMGDRANVVLAACVLYRGVLMTRLEPRQPATGSRRRAGPTR